MSRSPAMSPSPLETCGRGTRWGAAAARGDRIAPSFPPRGRCLPDRLRPPLSGRDAWPVVEGVDVELTGSRYPFIDVAARPVGSRDRLVNDDLDSAFLGHLRVAPH